MLSIPVSYKYEFWYMKENVTNTLKHIFNDSEFGQKEIADILKISQPGVSKKIKAGNFTIVELLKISLAKNQDFFSELSVLLPITIRNTNNSKERSSAVEQAILTLVKNNIK